MEGVDPSFLSLIPALLAIGLAFATRQVLPSLFLGVASGGLVLWYQTGDVASANIITQFFLPALGSESFAKILLIYLWCLGGLIGIWERTGGALYFAEQVGKRFARGPRGALVFTWLLGCIFHQGGTVSTVLTGTTVKPVADGERVSHEELAYVVDSTSSPIATILPFNAWPIFVAGLVAGTIPLIPDENAGMDLFISSLKFNFYGIFAVIGTLLFSLGLLPWVGKRMSAARARARETGALDSPTAKPMLPALDSDPADNAETGYQAGLVDFVLPIAVLILVAVVPYVIDRQNWINEAFMGCVLSAMLVALAKGMSVSDVMDGFMDGCKSMTIGAIILGLAVTMGTVAKELHTAAYLVAVLGDSFPPIALPGALSALCMIIAFSTGTSWGTYAVIFPVAMPLAWALAPENPVFLQVCFGSVLGGAVFGDQCSPISDTTILSSMFTGCDLMDHVNTQLPLALAAAGVGAVASTIVAAAVL
ncbi:MAG: Na+/H+ antiporter NhaC family protein [Myxococcota bacterium]|nr:Na+/H+ antiporter NhaC family protein [Myxococcota bacterium]